VKKIFKKMLTAVCAFALCIVCTGCSWLEINRSRYYDQIVATVGDLSFTKKDLAEAYNSYGYQYYEQGYYSSLEESITATVNSMIERKLLLEEIKKNYTLTDTEKLEVKKETLDYMRDSVNTFVEKVRKEWDCEIKVEEEAEKESLRDAEESYSPTTTFEIVKNSKGENEIVVSRVRESKETPILDNLPEHFSKDYLLPIEENVAKEAWTRYIKSLQDVAKSEERSTEEKDVLLHEENRLLEMITNNKYLEKFEDDFFNNTPVNVQAVLDYYREQYAEQKSEYNTPVTEDDYYSAYHTAMKDASKNYIFYHPDSGNQYINVKHILLNFNDTQKELVETLKEEMNVKDADGNEDYSIIESDEYQTRLKEIAGLTTTTFELDGEKHTWTADEVYRYVKDTVTGTFTERSAKFDDLIYIFNDDPGIMNSAFDYVVNFNTERVTDQMVKPFANGVRALDKRNGGEGEGSMDAIISDYGIHIIFHDGIAKNLFGDADLSKEKNEVSDEQLLSALCNTMTTPDSNKSLFNYFYDTLNLDENLYNNKTTNVINSIKTRLASQDIKIVIYKNNIKDMWE